MEPEDDFAGAQLRVVEDDDIPDIEEEIVAKEKIKTKVEAEAEPEVAEQDEVEEEFVEGTVAKKKGPGQGELELEGGPKGRFAGEDPNVEKGEDLDVPPYLRRRGRLR